MGGTKGREQVIKLRYDDRYPPTYMTDHSSASDVRACEDLVIKASTTRAVATGIFIVSVDWPAVPKGAVPELVLRARSGLATKHGVTLLNGVGTIDADYRDEIKVLLWNTNDDDFQIKAGDRIAQLVLSLSYRIPAIPCRQVTRQGGFGST